MATIDHSNTLDLRDLAELARECGSEIEDTETDEQDREEAADTLTALAVLCHQLGAGTADKDDAESIADALVSLSGSTNGYLIAEDHFEDYCRELVSDIGDLPSEVPSYISNNIDWSGIADDLRVDYTSYELDGQTYLLR